MPERIHRFTLILASLAVPLAAGAGAGLVDAMFAAVSPAVRATFPLFLVSASLGALVAAAATFAVVVFAAAFLRRPSAPIAASIAATVLLPAAFAFARFVYKRIPWDAADLALAGGGAFALAALFFGATRVGSAALGDGVRAARVLSRAAPVLLLLALPALARVVPAVWGELRAPDALGRSAAGERTSAAPDRRSNLLLVSIDTMRFDRFGITGDPRVRTPHLDRLARGAGQFPVCLTPSPWTLPSLASLLTGVHPGEHRMLQEMTALADSAPSLPAICRDAGWSTAAFVSNPWLATGSLSRGFETFDVAERLECIAETSPTRLSRALTKALLRGRRLDSGTSISRRGLSWIADRARDPSPWFLWLHYFDPHLPNWPAPPFDRLDGPPPQRVSASLTVEEIREDDFGRDPEARAEVARLYDAEVLATDRAIGAVARALEDADLLERTVVVVTADHGEEFWDHLGYGHGHSMFEEVVRVPLFVRSGRGASIDPAMARLIDVAPTAVAALGLNAPPASRPFAGRDLLAAGRSRSDAAADADTVYGEATLYGPEKKYLRTGRWKIIVDVPDSSTSPGDLLRARRSLYDLTADPGERRDVAASDSIVAAALIERLADWHRRVGSSRTATSDSLPEGLDPSVVEQLRALGYTR